MIKNIYVQPDFNLSFKSWKFPGGEIGFKFNEIPTFLNNNYLVNACLNDSDSIIELMMAVDAIRNFDKKAKIKLFSPYIPYGRQDRICDGGESFSLKVLSDLINGMNFEEVYTISPHSNVTNVLIKNLKEISINGYVRGHFLGKMDGYNSVLVAPDLGAVKRTQELAKVFLKGRDANTIVQELPIIISNKKRNLATGEIVGMEIFGDVANKKCFIFDDICDGGRTFVELAKILKEKGAKELYLFVTHGIFSKGFDDLLNYYEHITTTNSWRDLTNIDKVTAIDVYDKKFLVPNGILF